MGEMAELAMREYGDTEDSWSDVDREKELAEQGIWVTREGQQIPIREMGDRHLLNSRRLLDRAGCIGEAGIRAYLFTPCDVFEEEAPRYSPYVDLLDDEIKRRNLRKE